MPTYDYECEACHHSFEVFQGINDAKLKKCPECKKLKLKRLFGTGAAIVFKGSGFYQTDYRSESYKKGLKADQPKESKTEKTSSEKASSEKASSSSSDSSSGSGEKASGNTES